MFPLCIILPLVTQYRLYLVRLYHQLMGFFLQGFFDEDSMEEFIASDTEESSMSLTSEDERTKK